MLALATVLSASSSRSHIAEFVMSGSDEEMSDEDLDDSQGDGTEGSGSAETSTRGQLRR